MAVNKNDLQKVLDQIEALTGKKITLDLDTKGPQELAQLFDTYEEKLVGIRKQSSLLNMSLQETRDISKAIVQEMTKQNKTVQAARSAMSGLTGIATELLNEEREISALNQKRLITLVKQAKINKQSLDDQAAYLKRSGETTSEAIKRLKTESQSLDLMSKIGKQRAAEIANEKTILRAALDQEGIYESIVKIAEKRLKLEQATTKTFGLTGAALSAASTIASKFGMSHVSEQLDDIRDKLNSDIRKAVEENNGRALSFGKRFQFAGKAIGQTVAVLAKGMMDPLFIMGKIYTAFLDVNTAAVEYTRLTGQNAVSTAGMNMSLASSVDVLKVMGELTKEMGFAAGAIFSNKDLGRLAEAKNLLGLSEKQAANLGMRSKVAGKGIQDYEKAIVGATNKYNTANRSVVAHGLVLQEVLNTSDSISLSLGGNPEKLSAAASAALGLGINLEKVDQIAESLINFESSISAELEAELLTGKQLNLEKARELALNNDLAGLSAELAKNGASAAEFSRMNRIQQDSLAKALGMSRDELGKMAQQELLRAGASKEAQAAARGVTIEQLEQASIQDRIKISLDKLAQAFAPILDALVPVVSALISIVQPIAFVIASVAGGIGSVLSFLSPLITGFTIIYGLVKAWELSSMSVAGYQSFLTGQAIAQKGAAMGYNSLLLARQALLSGELAKSIGIAAAWAVANPLQALLGLGIAAGVGALVYSQMKDGVIDPKKGPVVSGEFGTVQLHPNDQIAAGTNLMGNKPKGAPASTMSQAVASRDNTHNEIRQMREENKSLLTALLNKTGDVYMDTNKVGRSQVLGSYKSA